MFATARVAMSHASASATDARRGATGYVARSREARERDVTRVAALSHVSHDDLC
jgi:hypothetical protein